MMGLWDVNWGILVFFLGQVVSFLRRWLTWDGCGGGGELDWDSRALRTWSSACAWWTPGFGGRAEPCSEDRALWMAQLCGRGRRLKWWWWV